MREILFRGKQEYKNGEWVFGSLHNEYGETDRNGERKIDHRILGMRGECDYVIPETVGQFTGLTDKNGKRIFEGDIVIDPYVGAGVVSFGTGTFDSGIYRYIGWHIKDKDGDVDHRELYRYDFDYEIIGNIHDNPELLEV